MIVEAEMLSKKWNDECGVVEKYCSRCMKPYLVRMPLLHITQRCARSDYQDAISRRDLQIRLADVK